MLTAWRKFLDWSPLAALSGATWPCPDPVGVDVVCTDTERVSLVAVSRRHARAWLERSSPIYCRGAPSASCSRPHLHGLRFTSRTCARDVSAPTNRQNKQGVCCFLTSSLMALCLAAPDSLCTISLAQACSPLCLFVCFTSGFGLLCLSPSRFRSFAFFHLFSFLPIVLTTKNPNPNPNPRLRLCDGLGLGYVMG